MPTDYRDWDTAKLGRLTDAATELLRDAHGTGLYSTDLSACRVRWMRELERRESVRAQRAAMATRKHTPS